MSNQVTLTDDQSALPGTWRGGRLLNKPLFTALTCLLFSAAIVSIGGIWAYLSIIFAALAGSSLSAGLRKIESEGQEHPRMVNDTRVDPSATIPLAKQIVPVWKRQIESACSESESNSATLLNNFSSISQNLDKAVEKAGHAQTMSDAGAMTNLMSRTDEHVEALLEPIKRAMLAKSAMLEEMVAIAATIGEMRKQAIDVKNLARHTNLVALNAAIEARRAGTAGETFTVVAQEVRKFANQSAETGDKLAERIDAIQRQVAELRKRSDTDDATDDELRQAARENARAVLANVITGLDEFSASSRVLHEASDMVRSEIDHIYVGFQHQDRLNQMLAAICEDMNRFGAWLNEGDDPLAGNFGRWLDRLEQSYTMESQRATHHGGVAISEASGVEFF